MVEFKSLTNEYKFLPNMQLFEEKKNHDGIGDNEIEMETEKEETIW